MTESQFNEARARAYAIANAASPEVLRETRNWIVRAMETGASFEEAKAELDQLLARHQLAPALGGA